MWRTLHVLTTASLLALSTVAMAVTIHVPADQPTIQAGIDAASYGDTVIVACGTYCEQPIIMKSGIYLISETGQADCVTIEAQWQHFWCVIDCVDLDSSTTIQGFTITGGLGEYGAGMRCMNSSPTIANVTFIDNYSDGHGVLYCQGSSPTLRNVAFLENEELYPGYGGGGIYCDDSSVTLTDCHFVANAGVGMYCRNSSLLGTGCEFAENTGRGIVFRDHESECGDCTLTDCRFVENAGGGMSCEAYAAIALALAGCSFVGNTDDYGGGLYVEGYGSGGDITLAGCSFVGNTADGYGGGLYVSDVYDAISVTNCTFAGNSAVVSGGGVYLMDPHSESRFVRCTIVGNDASYGAAIYLGTMGGAHPAMLENTIVAFNTGEHPLWEVWFLDLSCCDVYGNEGGDSWWCGSDGNICEDPLFCLDENPGEPYTLHENSPCAAGNNPECGQIGAWGVGCEAVTPVQAASWGSIKAMFR